MQDVALNTQFAPDINIQAREDFLKRMNEPPPVTKKQADYAKIPDNQDGYDTIPIGLVENTLDEVYLGLWKTHSPTYQVVCNEIIGTIILEVFDPSAKIWISRIGGAAVTIRQKKDSQITDISSKIKTALQMDFPKLMYSMCLKSAAKSLGKKFGRDLNRKFEDFYESVYTNEIELSLIMEELNIQFAECKTTRDLLPIWEKYPQIHGSSQAQKIFGETKTYLSLRELFEQKATNMTDDEILNANRILKNKETNSYTKLNNLLKTK